jgi:hypothetical protein
LLGAQQPYREEKDLWARKIVQEALRRAEPGEQIVVLNSPTSLWPVELWYLRSQAERITLPPAIDANRLLQTGRLWCLRYWADVGQETARVPVVAGPDQRCLRLVAQAPYTLCEENPHAPIWHADLCCFIPADSAAPRREPTLSVWP